MCEHAKGPATVFGVEVQMDREIAELVTLLSRAEFGVREACQADTPALRAGKDGAAAWVRVDQEDLSDLQQLVRFAHLSGLDTDAWELEARPDGWRVRSSVFFSPDDAVRLVDLLRAIVESREERDRRVGKSSWEIIS